LRCVGMRTSPVFFTGDSSATGGRRSEQRERAHPTLSAMHHAMNHVGFMISPELHVVQDRVHG
jgi:hypothetical protein